MVPDAEVKGVLLRDILQKHRAQKANLGLHPSRAGGKSKQSKSRPQKPRRSSRMKASSQVGLRSFTAAVRPPPFHGFGAASGPCTDTAQHRPERELEGRSGRSMALWTATRK